MNIRLAPFLGIFLGLAGAAHATDGAGMTALETWEADKSTIFQAEDIDLEDFRWIARPVVIFADTPRQPAFEEQMQLLVNRIEDLVDRDVLIVIDTDPAARTDIRRKLRPRSFMLTLIGKDGGVKLRKPFPWDVRELTRSIDKMPMRKQEVRDRRNDGT